MSSSSNFNSQDRFGVSTDNYLGFEYESYKRQQYAAALTKYSYLLGDEY